MFTDGPRNPRLIPSDKLIYDFRSTTTTRLPAIRCSVDCDPDCDYIWYKNNNVFTKTNVLNIPVITDGDHGIYQCYAYNDVGNHTFPSIEIIMFGKWRKVL